LCQIVVVFEKAQIVENCRKKRAETLASALSCFAIIAALGNFYNCDHAIGVAFANRPWRKIKRS
jgi:hypothetical protein